ncbi:MAG: response regulator transcription factor [Peptostreptococcaceae bacterium]|nr:response regulator transcription factor [Peptostreptococcaceae bacterium]
MIRVGIIDDHASIRDSYKMALERLGDFEVIGSLSSASLADIWCQKNKPDLVLMDICTEGEESGLEVTRLIKQNSPEVKVIVMTGFDEISYIPRAKEVGADGFVYKSKSFEYLIFVIRSVMNGEKIFPEPVGISVPKGDAPLTEREIVILRLLCKNYSRQEIAEELFISEFTVKRHMANMLQKTGFRNIMSLVVHMISNGWINPHI